MTPNVMEPVLIIDSTSCEEIWTSNYICISIHQFYFKAFPVNKLRLGAQPLLTTPYVMFEWKKNQIITAHQKEGIDQTKKSMASRQKKFR